MTIEDAPPAHHEDLDERRGAVAAGAFMARIGRRADLWLLKSGWAADEQTLWNGQRQIVQVYVPGDIVGFSAVDGVARLDLRALTAGVWTRLGPADQALLSDPRSSGGAMIRRAFVARQAALAEHVVSLGRLSALDRALSFLAGLHRRLLATGAATAASMPMPLTQTDLADHLGMSAVHMNRVLQMLRQDFALEIRRKGLVGDLSVLHRRSAATPASFPEPQVLGEV